jgi:hypothetical protein
MARLGVAEVSKAIARRDLLSAHSEARGEASQSRVAERMQG